MSAKQTAAYLHLSRVTVKAWTEIKFMPHSVDPNTGTIRYSKPRIDRWLADGCPHVGDEVVA